MIEEKFKNISIKGRVAYGISCLERALICYSCTLKNWEWVLEKIWEFTSIEYLDDWFYEMAEFLPDSLLEDNEYIPEEFEYITEKQFYILLELYQKESNQVINQIFNLIFEMGTFDLYSRLENYSPNTLICLEKINNIMVLNNIELPSVANFIRYSYYENKGWGNSFEGKVNSIIL